MYCTVLYNIYVLQVALVGETVEGHMNQLQERHERLSAQVEGGDAAVLASLQQTIATFEEATANMRSDVSTSI